LTFRFDRRREPGCRDRKKQGSDPKLVPSMNHHAFLLCLNAH
jgi:hypothetical protein